MKRVTMLLLLLTGAGAAVAVTVSFLPTNRVDAQPPKARPQWEYARLVEGAAAADYIWSTGKTTLRAPGDVAKPDPDRAIGELYRQLGGKEQGPTFGKLLDLIGQDGWELVSYSSSGAANTWTFKRP